MLYRQRFQDPVVPGAGPAWVAALGQRGAPLRHTFAVNLISDGASADEVRAALNHADVVTTMREYGDWFSSGDAVLRDRVTSPYGDISPP